MVPRLQLLLLFHLGILPEQRANVLQEDVRGDTNEVKEVKRYIQIEYIGQMGKLYQEEISLGEQIAWTFDYIYDDITGTEPFIHAEVGPLANIFTPVVFEIQHFQSESWSLPVVIGQFPIFYYINKTLCTPANVGRVEPEQNLRITVSTRSEERVSLSLLVILRNTRINSWDSTAISISPTSPVYFKVGVFPYLGSPYLRLDVSLTKHVANMTAACFTVSIQQPLCPVQDHQNDVQFNTISHTMSTTTTITLNSEDFAEERFLVFVMHEDYSQCDSHGDKWKDQLLPITRNESMYDDPTIQQLEFSFEESVCNATYLFATVGVLALLCTICAGIVAVYIKTTRSASVYREILPDTRNTSSYNLCLFFFYVKDSTSRTDVSLQSSCTESQEQISKSAKSYCQTLWVVSLFYTIPVFQFMSLYQHIFQRSGNEDQCYFNFKCLHPIKGVTAFNHVFSNVGYIILGILFIILVRIDHRRYNKRSVQQKIQGIFAHYGIYYAMGSALVMEGVMSALYHVCPTRLNFQFDTSFMYVTATLCMVKIYQSRHPQTNLTSTTTFLGMAFVVFLVVITTVYQVWWLWMTVTIAHTVMSLVMSVHIYAWGDWKLCSCRADDINFPRDSSFREKVRLFFNSFLFSFRTPMEPMTKALIVLNVLNWTVSIVGYLKFYSIEDIASYLLMIFLLNLGIYTGIYIIFKLFIAKENISWKSWVFVGLALPFWAVGLVMFFKVTATWNLSQAESREINAECVLLNFYDYHDIWHFLSAFGLFFTYLFLFTVDDGLKNADRNFIKVF